METHFFLKFVLHHSSTVKTKQVCDFVIYGTSFYLYIIQAFLHMFLHFEYHCKNNLAYIR